MTNIVLSDAEKLFLVNGIEENCRNDGRLCLDYREFIVRTNVVSSANGSARVKMEGNTDVLVGIKAELEVPFPQTPNEGKIDFFIDCSALASPRFEGREGKQLGTEIYNALVSVYCQGAATSNLEKLCIVSGKHCWLLNVDIVILECAGGSLYDVISLAIKAALFDTDIPVVEYDEESEEVSVVSNVMKSLDGWFDWESCPLLITVSKIGSTSASASTGDSHSSIAHFVDATLEEESCCNAKIVFGVDSRGRVSGCRKYGTHSLSFLSLSAMIETGCQVALQLNETLWELIGKQIDNEIL